MTSLAIYYADNGVGLTRDARILTKLLSRYDVKIVDVDWTGYVKADIAFHLELPSMSALKHTPINILIPNQDWWHWGIGSLNRFTYIACKTQHGLDLFSKHGNALYLGFTSVDRFDPTVQKEHMALHVAGKSALKGTESVWHAWDPAFPPLVIVGSSLGVGYMGRRRGPFKKQPNIRYVNEYIPDATLKQLQNQALIHVQPSEIEGYGHVLGEALSVGSILLTTDAPPMNEFPAYYAAVQGEPKPFNMGLRYFTSPLAIRDQVDKILQLKASDTAYLAGRNRAYYIENFLNFKQRFDTLCQQQLGLSMLSTP